MDLLELLHHKKITLEKAYDILDKTIERFHKGEELRDWATELGLSEYEIAARLQGADLDSIMRFRYDGWPTSCCKCKMPLDYMRYGWWFSYDETGQPCLKHLICPETPD